MRKKELQKIYKYLNRNQHKGDDLLDLEPLPPLPFLTMFDEMSEMTKELWEKILALTNTPCPQCGRKMMILTSIKNSEPYCPNCHN